jgi:LCP family protein required for cell wall assembly
MKPMQNRKRITYNLFVFLLFCIIISGCSTLAFSLIQGNPQTGNQISFLVSSLDSTPTPTPFLPLEPTPTYIPTAIPTLPPTPKPKNESASQGNPKPAGALDKSENQINIMVLGSDQRVNDGGFRTDTIILVSINTTTHSVTMISFPRDLYLYIPGWTNERINTVMFHGGFDLIKKTMQYNFGVEPDYYVMVKFDAFQEIINSIGGIDVEVAITLKDIFLDGNYKKFTPGTTHMNGATALWYARSRQTTNDFDRARRQQEVLQAVTKRILSVDALENAKDLYDIYIANVTTNLKWSEITPLIPLTVHLKNTSKIHRYVIGPGEVYDWITPGGAMVLLPRQDKIIALLKDALGNQ